MPIYEYECSSCGKHFEVFLTNHDAPVKKCQFCKSSKVKKLVSNCSFQLKGTGWYITDYARKNSSETKKKDKTKSTETESAAPASDTKTSTDTKASTKAAAEAA